jgi:hypothetical protein
MPIQVDPISDSKNNNESDMPDIPTLTRHVQELAGAHGFWNNFSVIFVALTAIAAVLYFIGQWKTIQRGNELSNVQSELIRAKDEELARNLKDKEVEAKRIEIEGRENVARVKADADEKIAGLTAEAERAKAERAEADKQIATAKADAARAKEGIANAEARSLEASAEVSRLRVTVANAERERAMAQKALLELQEQVRPRRLTASQRAKLLEILRSGPKGKVTFEIFVGDTEASDFLDEIAQVLAEAGWIISGGAQSVVSPPRGIGIFVHSKDSPPSFALFLQDALKTIGLDAESHVRDGLPTDIVLLYVGPKKL